MDRRRETFVAQLITSKSTCSKVCGGGREHDFCEVVTVYQIHCWGPGDKHQSVCPTSGPAQYCDTVAGLGCCVQTWHLLLLVTSHLGARGLWHLWWPGWDNQIVSAGGCALKLTGWFLEGRNKNKPDSCRSRNPCGLRFANNKICTDLGTLGKATNMLATKNIVMS